MSVRGQCVVQSATLRGVEAVPVDVEVVMANGIPGFSIVGLADASVQESRERVKAALRSCGFSLPASKVVVNLAPGVLRKTGSGFDLPIAAGILCASGQLDPRAVRGQLFVGELSLEGAVRPVAGLLAYALCAQRLGVDLVCAPVDQGFVALDGLVRRAAKSLAGFRTGPFPAVAGAAKPSSAPALDFRDIAGHDMAKRALQIAAAGGHGVLMTGPPGSGKTMLASRLPSILPPLSEAEAIETAVVHSVAGEEVEPILGGVRPFRSPHHSATLAGLVGGGSPLRPGEISLANNGVLFLDELAEFSPSVLQGIRQPLESGRITLTRADGNVDFPARFMLVAATNPCPCGYYGDEEEPCTCTHRQMQLYRNRIGGPIMDRIDVHIAVRRIPPGEVLATGHGTSSEELRRDVLRAREFASWRRARNGEDDKALTSEALVRACALTTQDEGFLEGAAKAGRLSGRAIMRTLASGGEGFPSALESVAQPPDRLYVVGDPFALQEGIAIVGARRATPYGRGCAKRFAALAARRGIVVVSGGARGCDAAAHAAALEEGGRTVAFLGGGCDRLYPAEHEGLFQRIVDEGGAVVSEHAWDEDPKPYRFRLRNRLIAGLARATLIVEAGLPSGTFSTADEALAANRDVLVVPGAITAVSSRGANRLIYQGATPVIDDETFEDALFSLFGCLKQETVPSVERTGAPRADEPSNPVADALRAEPLSMEQLYAIAASSCGGEDARSWLMERLVEAELAGTVARHPDGRWGPAVR